MHGKRDRASVRPRRAPRPRGTESNLHSLYKDVGGDRNSEQHEASEQYQAKDDQSVPVTSRWGRHDGGDHDGFEHFVANGSAQLLRAAYLLLGSRVAAEDALQTSLMKTFRHWRRARAQPAAYCRQVLINECRDQWRRTKRAPPETALLLDPESPVASSPFESIEQRGDLETALHRLPREQREVLILRYFLDLSIRQTAQALGIADGTVKSATSRGLHALRSLICPHTEETSNANG